MDTKYLVPYSECAMHMRIADKLIVAYRTRFENSNFADVWIAGQDPYQDVPYSALVAEILPHEMRAATHGQIKQLVPSVWEYSRHNSARIKS